MRTASRKSFVLGDLGSPNKPERDQEHQALRLLLIDLLSRVSAPFALSVVETTDATETTLDHVSLEDSSISLVEVKVTARRTGGSSGTAGDGAGYVRRALYQRVGTGNATLIGSIDTSFTAENQAGWNCTLDTDGADVRIRVVGASGNNVTWHGQLQVFEI